MYGNRATPVSGFWTSRQFPLVYRGQHVLYPEAHVSNFFGLCLVFSLCMSRGGLFRSAFPVDFRRYDQSTHTQRHNIVHRHSLTHTHLIHTLRDTPIAHKHIHTHTTDRYIP